MEEVLSPCVPGWPAFPLTLQDEKGLGFVTEASVTPSSYISLSHTGSEMKPVSTGGCGVPFRRGLQWEGSSSD